MEKKLVLSYDESYYDETNRKNDEKYEMRDRVIKCFILSSIIFVLLYYLFGFLQIYSFCRIALSLLYFLCVIILFVKEITTVESELPKELDNIDELNEIYKENPNALLKETKDGKLWIAEYTYYEDVDELSYSYVPLDLYLKYCFGYEDAVPDKWNCLNISVSNEGQSSVVFS